MSADELYPWVRLVHVGCAALSLAGFALRGLLMLAGSPVLAWPFVRIAPHVVDTLLLASAVWLSWALAQYPLVHGWLTAKLVALALYIALGMVALRRGRSRRARAAAYAGALLVAAYLVSVALARDWRGVFAGLVR